MNRKGHVILGAASGAGLYCADRIVRHKPFGFTQLLGAGGGGVIGGRLPDILEPATSPNHRGFCHSASSATLLAMLGVKALDLSDWLDEKARDIKLQRELSDNFLKTLFLLIAEFMINLLAGAIIGIFGGYLSHTIADSTTCKSIPLFA